MLERVYHLIILYLTDVIFYNLRGKCRSIRKDLLFRFTHFLINIMVLRIEKQQVDIITVAIKRIFKRM
jgi:hypothetical protein